MFVNNKNTYFFQYLNGDAGLVINFTGSYQKLEESGFKNPSFIDLSGIPETNGYCSDEAKKKIRESLKDVSPSGMHYLDDGNHHYLSFFMAEKVEEPFDLIVLDHHTDMQPSSLLPFLSCGSWVLESLLNIPLLNKVILIGPPEEAAHDPVIQKYRDRVLIISEQQANQTPVPNIEDRPVYLSVDLDVLSKKEIQTVWDQGSMTMEQLGRWLEAIAAGRRIIGVDFCG